MSTRKVELIHERLRDELARLGLKPAAAAKLAGEEGSQGLRDVLGGRKRLSADLLAGLIPSGVDASYVLTGIRAASAVGESAIHQAVLDAVDLLSLEKSVDAQQLARAVVKLCAKTPVPAASAQKQFSVHVGTNHGQLIEGGIVNHGSVNFGANPDKK